VKDCMPILTGRLQDTGDTEDSALGACRVLMSRPILRHLMQVFIFPLGYSSTLFFLPLYKLCSSSS
jgi:hypothetical protein